MRIVSLPLDWLKNQLEVGYEKQEYSNPIGRQEPAATLSFIDDLNIPVQKWDLVSKYRADYTGVHLFRYGYVNLDKKDSKSDNDLFWILAFKRGDVVNVYSDITGEKLMGTEPNNGQVVEQEQILFTIVPGGGGIHQIPSPVNGTVVYVKSGSHVNTGDLLCRIETTDNIRWRAISGDYVLGFTINGLEGGGYFNILLSPKHILKNHVEYLASILYKHEKIIRYTSSTETMSDLSVTYNSANIVVEKADLSIANVQPFFKPIIFEFDCVIPSNLPELLGELNTAGYIKFKWNNHVLKGFIIEIQGSVTDSVQTVKCIAHPDTPDNIQEYLHKRLPNMLYP